jgi:hypothetical protein
VQAHEFVCNLNEIYCCGGQDRCQKGVIVSAVSNSTLLLWSVPQGLETYYHTLVISQRLNQELCSSGLAMGKHAMIVDNKSPYINQ